MLQPFQKEKAKRERNYSQKKKTLHLKGSHFRVLSNPPTHRPTDHRPSDHRPLTHRPTDPPTHRPNNRNYETWQQKDFHFTENSHSLENYFGLSST